jgi:hypothetical protein
MSAASELIASLQTYALDAFNKADIRAGGLNNASFANQPLVFARPLTQYQTVPAPSVPSIPPAPTPAQLAMNFDAALVQVKGVVDSLQDSWLMTYFPAAMPTGFDPLMAQIIDGTIITEAMQEILWERAKQQGLRDVARFEDEAVSRWASRGFSMPGGVLNNQLIMKQQELLHMNAGFAAQQAIKAIDLQVEQTKFAAQIGTQLRLGLINALAQLTDAYARLPQAAADYAGAVARAQQAAYAAISDYYRMIITSSELSLRANIANADNDMKYISTAGSFIGGIIRANVDAQVAGVNVYAQSAAAALSGLTGVATVASTSTS